MVNNFLNKRWFAWNPSIDTVVALITALIMIGWGYYLLVHLAPENRIKTIYGIIFTSLLVIFPVWWLLGHRMNL